MRKIILAINLCTAAALPVLCRYVAILMDHSHNGWTVISANYLLAPERWIFAIGAGLFTVIHFILGPITTFMQHAKTKKQIEYMRQIELSILGAFLLIACVPAHSILGLHTVLCAVLACTTLLWMWMTIDLEIEACPKITALRMILFGFACTSICAMIALFPFSIIKDISKISKSSEKVIELIIYDTRWQDFAPFEWAYYFIVIIFFCTNLITISKNHRNAKK